MFIFFALQKSGLIKSSSFEAISAFIISSSHVDWCNFCIHFRSLKIPLSQHSKAPSKKIMIQIKLVAISMIFH
jgi:hypothetical protein